MIKGISIQNFRGILTCDNLDFNEINVFIGEFGSGKSTVLDAIYLLKFATERTACLKRILSRRTGRSVDLSSLWYKYETDHEASVSYRLNDTSYTIRFTERGDGPFLIALTGEARVECRVSWAGEVSYLPQEPPDVPERHFAANITLLDSHTLTSSSDIERNVLEPMKSKQVDRAFLRALATAFPTCNDYGFRAASPRNKTEFRSYLDFGDSRVLIDDVSDGLRNGLAILATACLLTDSALLLEEPENNIFPKALDGLMKALVQVCQSNRIQLFVTTHRPEVLASFVEHGKERATIFHFSRENGEVRGRPSHWNDTRILFDIGWDIGKLARGYEKFVIVEGDRDKLLLEESFQKARGGSPESFWITIVPARGLNSNVGVVLKALLPTEREIFVLPDLDSKSVAVRRNQILQSARQLGSEGYDVSERNGTLTISKESTSVVLKTANVIPLGDREGLSQRGFNFQSSSMDDYLLLTILSNSNLWKTLEIDEEAIDESKRCKDAKSAVNDVIKIDSERIRALLRHSVLPDSLVQIINAIAGDK